MRRKDKEIKDREDIESIIRKADICRIAFSDNKYEYDEKAMNSIAVIKVEIESMTGKKSGY